jgi:hypothetical protein
MSQVIITDCYLNKKGLSEYLSISARSIEKYEQHGLPYYCLDRIHLYKMSEVDDWLKRYQQRITDVSAMVEQIMKT